VQKKLTIKQILCLGFGTIFGLAIAANFVAQQTKNTLINSLDNVAFTYNILEELAQLNILLLEAETGQHGYLYAEREVFLEPYDRANTQLNVQIAELRQKIKDPKQQQRLSELQTFGVAEMDNFTEEVNRSVEDVESVSWQLTEIIEQVQAIAPRFAAVNRGMEEQSSGAQQISEVMVNLIANSQQMAGSLREINGAISQLNEAASSLHQEISRFQISIKEEENV
jgi:methyl-accepting chemotaxis protein WspA